ncbi:hypothetical protein JOM56_002518 [Amanita muscaria]
MLMLFALGAYLALAFTVSVSAVPAKVIVISVGGNTADDATKVFQPQSVTANEGDVVYFNFTLGNHTATQSLFNSPCVWSHKSDYSLNAFDSGFRNAGNGLGFTDMLITILDPNTPIWFFDYNTCAQGGVGAINANGQQTLQNFQDNAMNINGTGARSKSSSSQVTQTGSSAPPAQTRASNGAAQPFAVGIGAAFPLLVLALSL